MYYVYFLKNPQGKLYVGCTNNPSRRMIYHQSGNASKFTRQHKGFELIYIEQYPSLLEARRREKQIKGWCRAKKERLIKNKGL